MEHENGSTATKSTHTQTVQGPVQLEAKVHLVNPDTGAMAVVTYSFPPGRAPTEEEISNALDEAAAAGVPHDMMLMGPHTFFNAVLVKEKTGRVGNFAVPRGMYFPEGLVTAEYHPSYGSEFDDDLDDEEDEG